MDPAVPQKPPEPAPEFRKLDLQMLLQDLATAQRTLFEERRHAERRISEERERGRWEAGRVRVELEEKIREQDRQAAVLVRSLGRLQEQNDRLREDLAVARAKAEGAQAAPPAPAGSKGPILGGGVVPQSFGPFELGGIPPPKRTGDVRVPIVPQMGPALGFDKPITVVEPPGKPSAP